MQPTRTILTTSILAVLTPCLVHADVLDSYTFGPNGTTPGVLTPTTVATNVTATPISNDAGLVLDLTSPATQPTTTPYLRTTFTTVTTTEAAAVTNNADFKFTLTATSGFLLNLASLTFDAMRGGGSTNRGFAVRTSVDNFATTILLEPNIPTTRPTLTSYNIPLTAGQYQNLATITFKIFAFSPATGSSVDFDSFVVNGIAAPTTAIPNGYQWTGSSSNLWNTTAVNWTGSGNVTVPTGQYQEGVDTIFNDSGTNTNPISIPAAVHPNSVLFNNTTAVPYSFTGSPILTTTNVLKNGNGNVTFSNSVTAASVSINGGTLTIAAGGSVSTPILSVNLGSTFNLATGATLDPTSGLTVNANAILNVPTQTLATLNGDTNGILTLNGTALNVTGTSTYNGKITGSGSVTKNTSGVLTLGGAASDFTGGLSVTGPGTLVLAGLNPGGTQPVTATANAKLLIGAGVNSNVVLDASTLGSSGNQTLSGTLTLNSAVTLDAFNPVTNAAGDLNLGGQLIAPTNPAITINNVNGTNPELAAVRFRGPASTYAGTITVAGSAAKIELQTTVANGSPVGTATIIMPAGPITNNAAAGTFGLVNLRNNFLVANTPTTANIGNNFQITGAGTVFMNMLGSAFTGSTTVLGDLQIGDTQTIAAGSKNTTDTPIGLQFNSVHLTGGNATFSAGLTGNTNYLLSDSITLGPISQNVAGSGITTNGNAKVILTGINSFTGPTTVQASTLVLTAGSSISSSSTVTIATGAKLDAVALGTMNVPAAQTLIVSGTLDTLVNGTTPGTINLGGTLRGGGDGFTNGVVKATISASAGGTVSPGISGPAILGGQNISLPAGSHYVVDVSKATPGGNPLAGSDYDQFQAVDYLGSGAIQLGGDLTVNVGSGVETNDIFTILLNQSFLDVGGTFAGLPNGAVFTAGGRPFQISYFDVPGDSTLDLSGGVSVSIQALPEPTTATFLLLGTLLPTLRRRRR